MIPEPTVSKLGEKIVWNGFRKIIARDYVFPGDAAFTYEVKGEQHAVCVLAITNECEIILARQFRPGTERFVYELPGGSVDPGEEPAIAAARELLEETGYAGDLQLVGTNMADGYSTMIRFVYIAKNCIKIAEQHLEAHEPIDVFLTPLANFRDHVRGGDMTDIAPAYMALDYLGLL
jgi:ADP-ribose pyrophosphatase